jgi:hypothetical protein
MEEAWIFNSTEYNIIRWLQVNQKINIKELTAGHIDLLHILSAAKAGEHEDIYYVKMKQKIC